MVCLDALLGMNQDIRIVYREFPSSELVSQLAPAGCAGAAKQNRYLEVHRALMRAAARNQLSKDKIFAIAKAAGLNIRHLSKEMYQPAIEEALLKKYRQLARQFQVEWGNPAHFVAPTLIPRVMLDGSKRRHHKKQIYIEISAPLQMTSENIKIAIKEARDCGSFCCIAINRKQL